MSEKFDLSESISSLFSPYRVLKSLDNIGQSFGTIDTRTAEQTKIPRLLAEVLKAFSAEDLYCEPNNGRVCSLFERSENTGPSSRGSQAKEVSKNDIIGGYE